jgi:alcohol oxidase
MSGLSNQVPSGLEEVDVIIAGGGTAGLIVASRLSDEFPEMSILVVERGHDNYQDPAVRHPLFFVEHILDLGRPNPHMMRYQGSPEPQLGGRVSVVPAGSVLGGGSSINMLTYTRPQREDLDAWNMPGWGFDEVLPYLKKFETYHGPGKPELHGSNGPIHISTGSYGPTSLQDQFIESAAKMGIREAIDLQDFDSNNAVQRNLRYISPDGVRSDTGHAYLHPRLRDGAHPNLCVILEHEVEKIVFEKGRAAGVQIHGTPGSRNATHSGTKVIKARRMVVAAAGTIGTPLLLQRSGVGGREVLGRAGVEVVADVPGVGSAFQDHNTMLTSYYTGLQPNETFDDLLNGETTLQKMVAEKAPMLSWNSAEITSKVRPSEDEIAAILDPEALKLWERDFKNVPNRPLATISTANG